MPPVSSDQFPVGLLARFVGDAAEQLLRFLTFLRPLTVAAVTLPEGR